MRAKIILILILVVIYLKLPGQGINPNIQVFVSPTLHIFNESEYEEISQDFNYSYGLLIGNSIFLNNGTICIRTGYFIDMKNYKQVFSLDTISWYPKSATTGYLYSNIPVFVDYCANFDRKINPFISIGYIFGNILKQKHSCIYNNGEQTNSFPPRTINLKNRNYIYASIGFKYKIINNLSFLCEPNLKYWINSNANYDRDSKLSFGLRLGLNYNIFKRQSPYNK